MAYTSHKYIFINTVAFKYKQHIVLIIVHTILQDKTVNHKFYSCFYFLLDYGKAYEIESAQEFVLIILTCYWQPALWWLFFWDFTTVETFLWIWHNRDLQLPSGIILDGFVTFFKNNIINRFSIPQFAANSNRISPSDRNSRTHQDNIFIFKKVKQYEVSVRADFHTYVSN